MFVCHVGPGANGAIAAMFDGRFVEVADLPTPEAMAGTVKRRVDGAGLADPVLDRRARYSADAELAFVGRVGSMLGQGVASVFNLGHAAGVVEAVLLTLVVPVEFAMPGTWKRVMGRPAEKSASQAVASRMFPAHAGTWLRAKDHNRAEAALLAARGWRPRR